MPKKIFQLFILIALLLLNANSALASCLAVDLTTDINKANSIFAGKVTNIENGGNVTFIVSQVWQGPMNRMLVVKNINNENTGMWTEDIPVFDLDKEYLVYAVGTDDSLSTYGCSPTKLLVDAWADLTVLGQGQIISKNNNTADYTTPSTNEINFFDKFNVSQGLLIVNTILLLIVILLLIKKIKNEKL